MHFGTKHELNYQHVGRVSKKRSEWWKKKKDDDDDDDDSPRFTSIAWIRFRVTAAKRGTSKHLAIKLAFRLHKRDITA